MDEWLRTCILLCAVGFFKSIRPTEAFLTQYLMEPDYNLTSSELTSKVYPVATYSYLGVLLIILLVTDYARYKPIIILETVSIAGTYCLLIWGNTLLAAQIVEFMYAIGTASEVAYYTYIYANVSDEHYQKVTSYTRVAVLCGFFVSGISAQILITTKALEYGGLNYITLVTASVATALSLFLPKVKRSIYFHRSSSLKNNDKYEGTVPDAAHTTETPVTEERGSLTVSEARFATKVQPSNKVLSNLRNGFWTIQRDLKESYRNSSVVKWSLWWACGTCLNLQLGNYVQPLWEQIYTFKENDIYNGFVESASTLCGALAALTVGYIHCDWSLYGELFLTVVCLLDGACIFLMAETSNIWIAYCTYIVFRASYQMVVTVASFQVAKDIQPDTYGLIFGCNTFFALIIQSILTFIVVDGTVMGLSPRPQFLVYASYSVLLGVIFLVTGLRNYCRRRRHFNVDHNTG